MLVDQSKCEFRISSVEYQGHRIDEDGLHPLKDKISAILDAPSPTNVAELRAYWPNKLSCQNYEQSSNHVKTTP